MAEWSTQEGDTVVAGEVCGDTGADFSIWGRPLAVTERQFPGASVPCREHHLEYGGATFVARHRIVLDAVLQADGQSIKIKGLSLLVPDEWPKAEVLIGDKDLRALGVGDPLRELINRMHKASAGGCPEVAIGQIQRVDDRATGVAGADQPDDKPKLKTGDNATPLIDLLPVGTPMAEEDELDEATGPPPMAPSGESPETDPVLKAAVEDFRQGAHEDLATAFAEYGDGDEATLAKHGRELDRIIDKYGLKVFRVHFYSTDGPMRSTRTATSSRSPTNARRSVPLPNGSTPRTPSTSCQRWWISCSRRAS